MLGYIAALVAAALWAGASILFTRLRAHLSAPALNVLKTGLACIMMMATLGALSGQIWPTGFSQEEILWLALSGFIGLTVGDTLLFEALRSIGPRRTLLFATLSPPVTALVAWPVLDEPITWMMTLGIGVTLIGIGLVVLDRESGDSVSTEQSGRALAVGYLMAFGAAVCQALGNVATKLGGEHDALSMAIFRASVGAATLLVYIAIRYGLSSAFRPLRNEMREAPEVSNGFMWPWSRYPIWSTLIVATIIGTYLGIWLQVAGLRYAPSTASRRHSPRRLPFLFCHSRLFLWVIQCV